MGAIFAKGQKTFEEISLRLSVPEFDRLHTTFYLFANDGLMTKEIFKTKVLADTFPSDVSDCLYHAFGGTNIGIKCRELLNGLLVITQGLPEERIDLVCAFYSSNREVIRKHEFMAIIDKTEYIEGRHIRELFNDTDTVSLEDFKRWVRLHPNSTRIIKWLVGKPCPVLTFTPGSMASLSLHQTLAGVTHLDEFEIMDLEKKYLSILKKIGKDKLDKESLKALISPPLSEDLCERLFEALDENRDGHIDFREMVCGVSAAARGPELERQKCVLSATTFMEHKYPIKVGFRGTAPGSMPNR